MEYRQLYMTYIDPETSSEARAEAGKLLLQGINAKDPEALYYLAGLVYNGNIRLQMRIDDESMDSLTQAKHLLNQAIELGFEPAKKMLDRICEPQYQASLGQNESASAWKNYKGPLVDYNGTPIKINRKGVLYPVDAELVYEDGRNILKLSLALGFLDEEVEDQEHFREAVIRGIESWSGQYQVFGGQSLEVRVEAEDELRMYDTVAVTTRQFTQNTVGLLRGVNTESAKDLRETVSKNRSFATGFSLKGWSTKSRKVIAILEDPTNLEEVMHVAKHEFGHVLGLGDLYQEAGKLTGVDKGSYYELDPFYLGGKHYHLVMCDHHAPVTNNDIEMVVLAFWKNKAQLFQDEKGGNVSDALGKGN